MIAVAAGAILLCLLIFYCVVTAARERVPSAPDAEELCRRIQEVDVFELVELADELADLRKNPVRTEEIKKRYRIVRLQLIEQLKTIAANAAVVLRIAQVSTDEEDQRAVEELIDDALSVRLLAYTLILKLHTMWLFPRGTFKAGSVIFFYQRLLEHLGWQSSGMHPRVAAGVR
jgi:hypothetical protein